MAASEVSPQKIHVSVVTPTYNRRRFIPTLIEIYRQQTYPKEQMEWIILDDGRDAVGDLFHAATISGIPNIRYIRVSDGSSVNDEADADEVPEKMRIGAKRNRLNQEARGDILVAMDDDDYYPPDRIQRVVDAFAKYPRVDLAGSSEMNLYFTKERRIYTVGPYHQNHSTNGTMAWRKKYAMTHRYDEYVTYAEEDSFLDHHVHPMIQMDPHHAILVICHGENTVDKYKMKEMHERDQRTRHHGIPDPKSILRPSVWTLEDIVTDPKLRAFYLELT